MKLMKSHVFWFVVLGVLIFVIDEQTSDPLDTIVVDAALEQQVAALWAAQIQREPTEAEIASLVDDWITEEIWYRESMRLSLGEEDEIIRRRMIQKMQFIAEQEAELAPTEEELRAYFEANNERYEVPASISFEQLQFQSRDAATGALSAGESMANLAQSSMQSRVNVRQSPPQVSSTFGPEFSRSLNRYDVTSNWQGPIQSTFGWHLVKLLEKNSPSVAPFLDIRATVHSDYTYESRLQAQADFIEQVRSNYDFVRKED
ncbi:MAG: peptidyl-prolyl cis-trans isomerase [Pseudohongiellaceae bacterium]